MCCVMLVYMVVRVVYIRCVRLGEDPISDATRKQICETRTFTEQEYRVNTI